jgi:hypothetical protein
MKVEGMIRLADRVRPEIRDHSSHAEESVMTTKKLTVEQRTDFWRLFEFFIENADTPDCPLTEEVQEILQRLVDGLGRERVLANLNSLAAFIGCLREQLPPGQPIGDTYTQGEMEAALDCVLQGNRLSS